MAKFTDAVEATLAGYFNAGDQPTEAQFAAGTLVGIWFCVAVGCLGALLWLEFRGGKDK